MAGSLHSYPYEVFRKMLAKARQASGLTQVQLANALGKPQSYVSKFEQGERRLDFSEFVAVADVLGIDIVRFVEEYIAATHSAPTK
jgi:transcriptional regulator with XRE-family HTH domain